MINYAFRLACGCEQESRVSPHHFDVAPRTCITNNCLGKGKRQVIMSVRLLSVACNNCTAFCILKDGFWVHKNTGKVECAPRMIDLSYLDEL